jgi:hypothetical protein
MAATIKYLRGAAGIGLGTTIKCRAKWLRVLDIIPLHVNTASKLGPHTQTDRGTCPVVGL